MAHIDDHDDFKDVGRHADLDDAADFDYVDNCFRLITSLNEYAQYHFVDSSFDDILSILLHF